MRWFPRNSNTFFQKVSESNFLCWWNEISCVFFEIQIISFSSILFVSKFKKINKFKEPKILVKVRKKRFLNYQVKCVKCFQKWNNFNKFFRSSERYCGIRRHLVYCILSLDQAICRAMSCLMYFLFVYCVLGTRIELKMLIT